jgi:hypothetical protein
MITCRLLATVAILSLAAAPAMAQTAQKDTEQNGHHYQGGPKTEVPHHMGKKQTDGTTTTGRSGGHHYNGGPATSPHHMGKRD